VLIDSLMAHNSRESNASLADLSDLRGARYVTTSETEEGQRLAQGKLKRITQGMGKIKATLDPKSFIIATYALCGFANFSSIAIQIGGIGGLAPSRKSDLARLGLRAVAAGSMANFMSACIAGMLL